MCEHCKHKDKPIGDKPCDTCGDDDEEYGNFVPSVQVMIKLITFAL